MRTEHDFLAEAPAFERAYPGSASQPRHVRVDLAAVADGCPAGGSPPLLASDATNAIFHSRSGHPERTFTVRATLSPVPTHGWRSRPGRAVEAGEHDVERGRGLAIVAAVAGDGNWGIEGDAACRVAWFRLDWQQ